jgi:hypothetical protein
MLDSADSRAPTGEPASPQPGCELKDRLRPVEAEAKIATRIRRETAAWDQARHQAAISQSAITLGIERSRLAQLSDGGRAPGDPLRCKWRKVLATVRSARMRPGSVTSP